VITFLHNAGVYTTSIDPKQQQVTVTGSIDSDILLKKLSKTGKHAEICSNKSSEKVEKNEKPSDTKTCQNKEQITPMLNAPKKCLMTRRNPVNWTANLQQIRSSCDVGLNSATNRALAVCEISDFCSLVSLGVGSHRIVIQAQGSCSITGKKELR